jgi:hypothetical protein
MTPELFAASDLCWAGYFWLGDDVIMNDYLFQYNQGKLKKKSFKLLKLSVR